MPASSFRFRLERIRALREQREQAARAELASALGTEAERQAHLQAAEAQLIAANEDHREALQGSTVDVAQLHARQHFVERVEHERELREQALANASGEVAARGRQLQAAAREHRMLERLKERRRAEHQLADSRRESNALDEIAGERFRRNAA